MKVYLLYECYFTDAGVFKKVLRKIYNQGIKVQYDFDTYNETLLQWLEVEERELE